MKIFVDDQRPAPSGWTWVKTVRDALRLLEGLAEPLEAVSLDYQGQGGETFEAVAYYIEQNIKPLTIYIHSGNEFAMELMSGILKSHKVIQKEYSDILNGRI